VRAHPLDQSLGEPFHFDRLIRPIGAHVKKIQSSEAKTHLLRILDEVEAGESYVVTRHGRAVARLVPEADRRAEATEKALVALQKIGRRLPMLTLADIMSGRHDGHDS
jgi:prevent-host-death family protein